MKQFYFLFSFLLLLALIGCDDDKVITPSFSIEEQINNSKPYDYVTVFNPDSIDLYYARVSDGLNINFTDAYAEIGFLVVIKGPNFPGTQYFNLSLVKFFNISDNSLSLYY